MTTTGNAAKATIVVNGFSFDAVAFRELLVRVHWKQTANAVLDTWTGCEVAARVTADWLATIGPDYHPGGMNAVLETVTVGREDLLIVLRYARAFDVDDDPSMIRVTAAAANAGTAGLQTAAAKKGLLGEQERHGPFLGQQFYDDDRAAQHHLDHGPGQPVRSRTGLIHGRLHRHDEFAHGPLLSGGDPPRRFSCLTTVNADRQRVQCVSSAPGRLGEFGKFGEFLSLVHKTSRHIASFRLTASEGKAYQG